MPPITAVLDHLVVAAATLDRGCDWVEERLGARPQPGGKHVAMGTHNALLRLGPRVYLEVIAIDPAAVAPTRPRWFDLDEVTMKAALAEGPRLVHWVARTGDLDALAGRLPALGAITPMQRGAFTWRITIPADGQLPARGLVPTLIQWSDGQHPADGLPDQGLSLVLLAGEHPEPATVRANLATLGLGDFLKVTYARTPRLAAMIRTRRGTVAL